MLILKYYVIQQLFVNGIVTIDAFFSTYFSFY
jgi:hypothetical protein